MPISLGNGQNRYKVSSVCHAIAAPVAESQCETFKARNRLVNNSFFLLLVSL